MGFFIDKLCPPTFEVVVSALDWNGATATGTARVPGPRCGCGTWGALHSKTGRVICVRDWLRDATGLDFGDRLSRVVDLQRGPGKLPGKLLTSS